MKVLGNLDLAGTGQLLDTGSPVSIPNGGTGQTTATAAFDALSPLTTTGDTLYFNGTHNVRLPIGTTGQVLTVVGGVPAWSTQSSAVSSVTGTANQVTASPTTGAVVLSIPSTFIAPGSIEATTSVQVDGNTASSFIYSDASKKVVTTAAPTNGQLLIGSTGAVPVAATLTAGTLISIVNGAGSITINNTSTPGSNNFGYLNVPQNLQASTYSFVLTDQGESVVYTGSTAVAWTIPTNTSVAFPLGTVITLVNPNSGGVISVTPAGGVSLFQAGSATSGTVSFSGTGYNLATLYKEATNTWVITGTSTVVTSVALADGSTTPIYTITGSPVTSTGTLTFTLSTQTANTVFAGPTTGAAAQPTFRALVNADVATVAVNSFQTSLSGLTPSTPTTGVVTLAGTLGATSGGTGSSSAPTAGQFLFSSGGTTYAPTTLSAQAVTTFSAGTTGLTPSAATSGAITLAGTLVTANGGTGLTSSGAAGHVLTSTGTIWASDPLEFIFDSTLHGGPLSYYSVAHNLNQKFVTVQVYTQDTQYPVVSTTNPTTITIAGNQTAVFTNGVYFIIAGSSTAANNAAYTVSSSSFDGTNTNITITGTVTTQGASGEVVVGPSQVIPQAVFLVDANTAVVTLTTSLNVFVVVTGITGVVGA